MYLLKLELQGHVSCGACCPTGDRLYWLHSGQMAGGE